MGSVYPRRRTLVLLAVCAAQGCAALLLFAAQRVNAPVTERPFSVRAP
jgi:hypothetical protein